MLAQSIKNIDAFLLAFRRKTPALFHSQIDRGFAFGRCKRRKDTRLPVRQRSRPFFFIEVQGFWRERFETGAFNALHLQGGFACVVIVGDQVQARGPCVMYQLVQRHHGARQIVKQCVEVIVEQRQPVFHAKMFTAFTHRFVKRIRVGDRTKRGDITCSKPSDRFTVQMNFAGRHEINAVALANGQLVLGIECANAVQGVAKHVQTKRIVAIGRIEINDPTPYRVFARLAHSAGAVIPVDGEISRQPIQIDAVAHLGGPHTLLQQRVRRHSLKGCIDRGEHDPRTGRLSSLDKRSKRRHAARDNFGLWRNPVVWQAVPCGKSQYLDVRSKKRKRFGKRGQACVVPGDMQQRLACIRTAGGTHQVRNHQGVIAFGRFANRQGTFGRQNTILKRHEGYSVFGSLSERPEGWSED